jgi:hypothetical protein
MRFGADSFLRAAETIRFAQTADREIVEGLRNPRRSRLQSIASGGGNAKPRPSNTKRRRRTR